MYSTDSGCREKDVRDGSEVMSRNSSTAARADCGTDKDVYRVRCID
jgi:hypothetical protein